jgi:hypothetical protein
MHQAGQVWNVDEMLHVSRNYLTAPSSETDRRRITRYAVQVPLTVLEINGRPAQINAATRDISLGGVCFFMPEELKVGAWVTYLITLSPGALPVKIRCVGQVLRCAESETRPGGTRWEAAVGMQRYAFVREESDAGDLVSV